MSGAEFIAGLLEGSSAGGAGRPWLDALRHEGLEAARRLGVPSPHDEAWRFLKLRGLTEAPFRPLSADASVSGSMWLSMLNEGGVWGSVLAPEARASRIVFVDGAFWPELTQVEGAGPGVSVGRIADAVASGDPAVQAALGRVAPVEDGFAAANMAHLRDGAVIKIGRDVAAAAPIQIVSLVTATARAACFPRCLILVEAGAKAVIVEDYDGGEGMEYLTDAVTELVVGESAKVEHIRIQREAPRGYHVATTAARVGRHGSLRLTAVDLGARLSRHNVVVRHDGVEAHSELHGLAILRGEQVSDTHSLTEHAHARGTSAQTHKVIVDERGHAIFNGRIVVQRDAQQIDAQQLNQALLLSARAKVNAKPQLEIFADDVKCTHGATVGRLDDEQAFYLATRGLSAEQARAMLTYAFAASIVEGLPVPSIHQRLTAQIAGLFGVEL